MKKLTKATLATVSLAASLTMLVAGCGNTNNTAGNNTPATSADKPVDGGTVTIGQSTKFEGNFLPPMISDLYTQNIANFAFDPLLTIDNKLNFVKDLASSYSWSDDKKTLTITLDKNANWTDGTAVTSDDVLYTMDFLGSKVYSTTLQGQLAYLVGPVVGSDKVGDGTGKSFADVGGFKKIDDKNFSLSFAAADAAVLWSSISAIAPIPKHSLQGVQFKDFATADFAKKPTVTDGAYKFTNVNGTDSVEMVANDKYFLGKPHITNVTYKTISADVAPGLLANGTLDMELEGLKPADVDKLKGIPNVSVQLEPSMGYQYMGFKLYQKEFQDVQVRQAFMYAINRQAMVDGLLKGHGQILSQPLPNVSWAAATAADGLNDYTYNVDKANQLLDAAGWKVGADGWRIDPVTGKTANISLEYPLGNTVRMASAPAIVQDMAKVHVKINLHSPEDFTGLANKVQADDKSIYLWLMGWSLSVDPDPRGMWGTKDAYNYPRWTDATNEDLMKKTYDVTAFDKTTRKASLVQWALNVNKNVPYVFLYQPDDVYASSTRLHIPTSDWSVMGPLNPYQWWVK
jgi:peptide/nickel transport system substrate-binding protein